MKNLVLFIAVVTSFFFSNLCAQTYNKWSIGAGVGVHDGVRYSGKGIIKIYQFHHFDINTRYMHNTKFGFKADFGFDHFGWINLKYPTNYLRFSFQSVVNLTNVLSFNEFTKKYGALIHTGFGYSFMWNEGALDSEASTIPLIDRGKTDRMLHGMVGITPQYKINNRFSLNMDLTWLFHLRQEKSFDFLEKIPDIGGFTSSFFNLSIGGSYYLGKNKQHADWVQTTNEVDKNLQKIVLLESELELLKLKLEDFDGDGVSNYQDDEPNTAPGATVDSRGVTVGNLSGVEITTKQKPSVINSVTNSDKDTTSKIVYKDSSKPDKDKDGVPDEFDICPELVGTYKGCPDADGDFIPDITDDCPSLKGTEKNHGCPENGTIEKQIILQTVPEIKNEKPLENQVEIEVKETLLSEVFFEIGSSILSTKALNQLDLLVKLLVENPKLNVSAVGVADQTGSQSVNEKLSLKRVNECVDYMVKKGINRERFIVSYKVAINTNGTNKLLFGALNRKVTFTVKK
jgi:outer membrane protein OmpA-like peptidoglycan-associated protein